MGKRELVLVALFVVMGVVVYQFTAPPPPPGSEGVTFGGIVGKLRREIQGNRETATATVKQAVPVDLATRLVRINFQRNNDLTITGTDGNEVSVEMTVTARGFDQAEAKAAADSAQLKLEKVGDAIAISSVFSAPPTRDRRGFVNNGTITVMMPRRLLVRVEPHVGKLIMNDVAGIEVMGSRGDTRIKGSTGHVVLTHTGGGLEIDQVPSLKLTARNSRGSIKRVAGTVSIEGTGGELELAEIAGPLDVESRNIEWSINAAKTVKPPMRFNGNGGRLRLEGLRSEARIDGRNLEMDINVTAAAPITVYNTNEDILITPPPGGYSLDAVATEGKITSIDANITATPGEGPDARASAQIRGGGPPLTLRVTRGRIDIRKPAGK
jgi:hypothetical protein